MCLNHLDLAAGMSTPPVDSRTDSITDLRPDFASNDHSDSNFLSNLAASADGPESSTQSPVAATDALVATHKPPRKQNIVRKRHANPAKTPAL